MEISLRKMVVLVAIIFVLLVGIFGESIKITTSPMMHHTPGIHAYWFCPGPPFWC